MRDAARCYAAYRRSDDAWALGRFVISSGALGELASTIEASRAEFTQDRTPWPLAVVLGAAADSDFGDIEAFTSGSGDWARVECIEAKADSVEAVGRLAGRAPPGTERYVEVDPKGPRLRELLAAIRDMDAGAKIRTGGVSADAFPTPEALLGFLRACHEIGVRFKATAGLHHPLRAAYRLTYAPDSPTGMMFGYLNLVLAAAFVHAEADNDVVLGVLTEQSPQAIEFADAWISWRGRRVSLDALSRTRRDFMRGIGSCSFREPLDDLARIEFGTDRA